MGDRTHTPNAADLDQVLVGCECGNKFHVPRDAAGFIVASEDGCCGQCGESGKMEILAEE